MYRTGWPATPARVLPALLAAILATVAGWGGAGSARVPGGATALQAITVSAAHTQQGANPAPTDARLTLARAGTPTSASPGAALAARYQRPTRLDRGRLAPTGAGRHVPVVFFSLFRSRAPPAAAW
jgi:hypothetical protein